MKDHIYTLSYVYRLKEENKAKSIKKFMEQMEAVDYLRLGNIWWFIDQTGI
jgi:hypothetical protein